MSVISLIKKRKKRRSLKTRGEAKARRTNGSFSKEKNIVLDGEGGEEKHRDRKRNEWFEIKGRKKPATRPNQDWDTGGDGVLHREVTGKRKRGGEQTTGSHRSCSSGKKEKHEWEREDGMKKEVGISGKREGAKRHRKVAPSFAKGKARRGGGTLETCHVYIKKLLSPYEIGRPSWGESRRREKKVCSLLDIISGTPTSSREFKKGGLYEIHQYLIGGQRVAYRTSKEISWLEKSKRF